MLHGRARVAVIGRVVREGLPLKVTLERKPSGKEVYRDLGRRAFQAEGTAGQRTVGGPVPDTFRAWGRQPVGCRCEPRGERWEMKSEWGLPRSQGASEAIIKGWVLLQEENSLESFECCNLVFFF